MILPAYNKSEIARLYFLKKGEKLTRQNAANRMRMITPDPVILNEVFDDVYLKQKLLISRGIRGDAISN
jgi:hypothetical protein